MVGWHPSKSVFFFVKKMKSVFVVFFCSKLIRTSKWWDGTLRRTCSYPRHTTTLFVRGKLMKMTGPLLRSMYDDTYASGKHKNVALKKNEKNVALNFFIDFSGKLGPIF